ncbi:MAG: response regulator [Leptospiraceae bacterium]|nr:response regulator [Leptospiraceae bacterium]
MNSPLQILLVEDEVITAMLMIKELKKNGFEVVSHVTTGENAIEYSEENKPDLILMDIQLAGSLDGIEAAKQISNRFHIPVIFITCYEDDATRERAKIPGSLRYLLKPVDMAELKSVINAHFHFQA